MSSRPLDLNREDPRVMHIDLNSCFATVEQQSRPSLRGKPIGVTNRISPHCCMIALSYEAKAYGAKVGMRYDEVAHLVPHLVVLETDPPKYHHAYQKLVEIMKTYSPRVEMKSIDEGIIDFHGTDRGRGSQSLSDIGHEIKDRLRSELGCWMKCNIGIAPNRFLAKVAAGFNKPDGLTEINASNILDYYDQLALRDLPGIAQRFGQRLNDRGIMTPRDFLDAPYRTLRKNVFASIIGEHWYKRLRGYEVDDVTTNLGTVGKQFALDVRTFDENELMKRLAYLCYSTGRKLRYNNVRARGMHLYLSFHTPPMNYTSVDEPSRGGGWRLGGPSWYKRHLFVHPFSSDRAIFENAALLFDQRPRDATISLMSVTCYHLSSYDEHDATQLELFRDLTKEDTLTETMDDINDRFGLPAITMTAALGAHDVVKQKIPFGSTKYFQLLCARA